MGRRRKLGNFGFGSCSEWRIWGSESERAELESGGRFSRAFEGAHGYGASVRNGTVLLRGYLTSVQRQNSVFFFKNDICTCKLERICDVLPTFFFSYQPFELKLPTFLTKLPTSCSIILQDILHVTGW